MTRHASYHPGATAEFRAEIAWYEERRSGLGDRFEAEVASVIDGLLA